MDIQNQSTSGATSPNPQVQAGQNLTAPVSNLQTSTSSINNTASQAKITSIGDSTFKSFDPNQTVTTTINQPKQRPSNHLPVLALGGVVICFCLFVAWIMARSAQNQLGAKA